MGSGDPYGMPISHALASGMGGIRTAGDLVARMQLTQKMRISEAKAYVADKLKVGVADLVDVAVMRELREELGLGVVLGVPGSANGMEAKANIADVLGIRINCLDRLAERTRSRRN